jgi:hypothetical protein
VLSLLPTARVHPLGGSPPLPVPLNCHHHRPMTIAIAV